MSTVALTGTPGTGKTTVSELVADRLEIEVVHLNDAIREAALVSERDVDRDSLIADLDAVEAWLDDYRAGESGDLGTDERDRDLLVESHLAHLLDVDRVVVLRCHPETLKPRLRARGESEASVAENAESEALDGILATAVDRHGEASVWEVDTTDRTPEAVADDVAAAIEGRIDPRVGVVDFIEYL
ncbi:AAA family ATPase [Halobellus ruber]|uniref:Putative adenylate kinase n=1 Tax=Halobellus ruber TaxID=2761102 RepID=A0A7J9SN81_9EURY|nr:adenylate kinase family protein [Halobellus ruber]